MSMATITDRHRGVKAILCDFFSFKSFLLQVIKVAYNLLVL